MVSSLSLSTRMYKSEYKEKYCGEKGKRRGQGGGGGSGDPLGGLEPCKHGEDVQPVGGRVQAAWRAKEAAEKAAAKQAALEAQAGAIAMGQCVPPPFQYGGYMYDFRAADAEYTRKLNQYFKSA